MAQNFFSGQFLKSQTFWIVTATATLTIAAYALITRDSSKQPNNTKASNAGGFDIDTIEKTKKYLEKEFTRLRNPKLTYSNQIDEDDSNNFGYLQKKDFYDLLMLIQLKSKLKLQKDTHKK